MSFEVMPHHLSSLSPSESVELIRDLVWSDASVSGIPENLIDIPSAINVSDGGIDGKVAGAKFNSKHGIIKAGITCYQVKSGVFSASMKPSQIDEILLDGNTLKSRIKSCLEKDGTLVIAFTGWDNPDYVDDDIKNKFQMRLKQINSKYDTAKIEIWRQNTIMGFLQNFPSLRLKILKMHNTDSLFFHDAWARLDDMTHTMHLGDIHNEYLQRFRKIIRSNDRPIHIRVTGDPGMGKTRLVLEALKPIDLAPLTIYVRNPGHLHTGSFLHSIANYNTTQSVILVVDECDYSESADIWNQIKDKSPHIKLVTIFNETRVVGGNTVMLTPPNLQDEQIDSILGSDYEISHDQRSKWVNVCQPSPRAAHVIGQNLQKNPDDILRDPDTVNVWDRFIADTNSLKSPEFEQRKTILLWLSLFKRFGFEPPFDKEAKFISDKISENHAIPYGKFVDIINTLKNMHILQGHTTLYITPKILHIKLWTEWWSKYGPSMMFNLADIPTTTDTEMFTSEPQNLRGWYCEMFKYARESPVAQDVVKKLLGPGGLLEHDDLLSTELGANFILTLASADPNTTLSFLGRTIGGKNKNDLMKFEQGRRQTVQILWKTSIQKGLFADSAQLLLALGEAENEPYTNNASGIFASLFSPAQGPLAPTEMPPSQRLPVIRDAIHSNSKERRLLAIHACSIALQTETSNKVLPLDDVFRWEADLWMPKSRQEITEYYKDVLDILQNSFGTLHTDEKQLVISTILDNVKGLLSMEDLADHVIKVLQNLHDMHHVDNEPIIEQIEHILAFDTLYVSHEVASKLKTLQNHLTGSDYHSKLVRYAGMHPKIDWFSESRKNRNEYAHKDEIESLARQSLDTKRLLPELTWLVTDRAKNGHRFGLTLGLFDDALALLSPILEAQRNAGDGANEMFLAGYFRALFERDVNVWESQLDLMADDDTLYKNVMETTRMSGMTDRAGRRITALLHKHDDLGYADLASFQYGMVTHELSESVFVEWVELLLDAAHVADATTTTTIGMRGSMATITALHLFYAYFMQSAERTLPKNLTLRLLFHDHTSRKPPSTVNLSLLESFWTEICMRFIKQYPEERILVIKQIFERFENDNMFGRYKAPAQKILDDVVNMMLQNVLRAALCYVRVPVDSRTSCVTRWIQKVMSESKDNRAEILDVLFEWVDEDPEVRAVLCAKMIPVTPEDFDAARQILIKYGTIDDVQKTLGFGLNSESYQGSASVHYEKIKEKYEILKNQEGSSAVRQWLESHISQLDFMVHKFGVLEERDEI